MDLIDLLSVTARALLQALVPAHIRRCRRSLAKRAQVNYRSLHGRHAATAQALMSMLYYDYLDIGL